MDLDCLLWNTGQSIMKFLSFKQSCNKKCPTYHSINSLCMASFNWSKVLSCSDLFWSLNKTVGWMIKTYSQLTCKIKKGVIVSYLSSFSFPLFFSLFVFSHKGQIIHGVFPDNIHVSCSLVCLFFSWSLKFLIYSFTAYKQ